MTRVLIVNPTQSHGEIRLPYLWLCLKSYYAQYGLRSDVVWIDPIIDVSNLAFDDVVRQIVDAHPDIVGFSNYVWNATLNNHLAQAVRNSLPEATIVFGGPHVEYRYNLNWFKQHPHVDAICSIDGYGEEFFAALLDEGKQWNAIPNAVYPSSIGWTASPVITDKRRFKWPDNMFAGSDTYLQMLVGLSYATGVRLGTEWETVRGCPYGCTYCEWGGGINSKLAIKPQSILEAELASMRSLGISAVSIIDANFGILPRDMWIAEQLVEWADAGSLKQVWLYGKHKNNKDIVEKIDTMMFDANLYDRTMYLVAINASTKQMLSDVKRTNVPIDENIALGKRMREKYGTDLAMELILGLPGTTLDTFYAECDLFTAVDDWTTERYPWALLPETPAARPEYRLQHQLISARVQYYQGDDITHQYEVPDAERGLYSAPEHRTTYEIVVGTYSYTTEDWVQIYIMDHFMRAGEMCGITKPLRQALRDVPPGLFYRQLWLWLSQASPPAVREEIDELQQHVRLLTRGQYQGEFKYFPSRHCTRRVKLETFFRLLVANNLDAFYDGALELWPSLSPEPISAGKQRARDTVTPITVR